ncbi:SDR family NAD(P)-dependent oxidoreductase [Halorhabdus sp. CUG00001]|uniref:SDR family NAD(P)-dependent oxidoreductase n=1 Tax=Halorhabdus sp. CUG00001 TaxID=2600297 RepID=UPI00131E5FFF|nr:SDR family NAD(P)-dependent oxidoreductase [Halorhabdus sp. CUG00001]
MKTVLVTGAASGIGRATAHQFATRGWNVYASDVDPDGLATLTGCHTATVDVTDQDDLDRIFERIHQDAGGLDAVVANAGYCQPGPLEDLPPDWIDRQFAVNVHGTLRTIRTALPLLGQQGGTAIAVSSTHGRATTPGMGAYAASKHAVEGLLDTLRVELSNQDVAVVLVEPAWVDTDLAATSDRHLDGFDRSDRYATIYEALDGDALLGGGPLAVSPERVAATIYDAATTETPAARYPVGLPAKLILATRWLPQPIQDFGHRVTIAALAALSRFRRSIVE